jgi:hypothetical protein
LQISSIKRRNAVSIMSRAICRSSPSVGMRPALKIGSKSVRRHSHWLSLRNRRVIQRGIRKIYVFGRPNGTLFDRLWFRSDPFGYEGVYQITLGRPSGGAFSKDGLSVCGSFENSAKKRFTASLRT